MSYLFSIIMHTNIMFFGIILKIYYSVDNKLLKQEETGM